MQPKKVDDGTAQRRWKVHRVMVLWQLLFASPCNLEYMEMPGHQHLQPIRLGIQKGADEFHIYTYVKKLKNLYN